MAKKQHAMVATGCALSLQTRTAVLNGDLQATFERWYPGITIGTHDKAQPAVELKRAA